MKVLKVHEYVKYYSRMVSEILIRKLEFFHVIVPKWKIIICDDDKNSMCFYLFYGFLILNIDFMILVDLSVLFWMDFEKLLMHNH